MLLRAKVDAPKIVLYPLSLRLSKGPGRFEFQYTFVEGSGPFHVRHRISGKCYFEDFHALDRRSISFGFRHDSLGRFCQVRGRLNRQLGLFQ